MVPALPVGDADPARHVASGTAIAAWSSSAISVQETSPADVAAYADRYELGYTIGFDGSGKIFHAYKGYALPTQFFIDENGVIASIVGAPLDEAGAVAQIEAILPKGGGATTAPNASTAPNAPAHDPITTLAPTAAP